MSRISVFLLALASLSAPNFAQTTELNGNAPPKLVYPNGVALGPDGNLYISDIGTHQILKLNQDGALTVVAGTGQGGFGGDDGLAVQARLFAPHDLAFDLKGNLLIADTYNHRIRRINPKGIIDTIVGNGKARSAGDNGPALQASLNNPQGIALDKEGNLFIADTFNYLVRRVDHEGTITTFAGSEPGLAGDGGPATKAQLSLPMAVAVASDGSVYLSDAGNSRIRRVDTAGIIQTVAGYGPGSGNAGAGFSGDGGRPEKAKIFSAADVELDAAGNLYLSDSGNNRIRVVRNGIIRTIAGSGEPGFNGNHGDALTLQLNTPHKITLAPDGSVFIADRANHRIRKISPNGMLHTIAGDSTPNEAILESP